MEDSVKRMRIEIVASGLGFLLANAEGASRKQFFLTDPKDTNKFDYKKLQLLGKANASKNWQQGVLDRLISSNLIKKISFSNGIGYQIDNFDRVAKAFDNYKSGDGLIISHYVFPSEVPAPEIITVPSFSESPNNTEEVGAEVLLQKILENIIYVKTGYEKFSVGMAETIKAFLQSMDTNRETLTKIGEAFKESSSNVKSLENRINGSNKRMEDIEETIKKQSILLEANQRTAKEILSSANSIGQVSISLQNISTLAANVSDLTKEIKAKEQNNLTDIGRQLTNSIKEMSALQEQILNATIGS